MKKRLIGGKSLCVACLASAVAAALVVLSMSGPQLRAEGSAAEPALERAREQVKMLDELYKLAVVSITNKYDGPPAIRVAQELFAVMEKSGWHKAKLVYGTGDPKNEANLPKSAFEKRAVVVIQAGKPYYEEVTGSGTDRTLHAATIVPAVMKKCASCHGVKQGDLLGFIRYEIPVN